MKIGYFKNDNEEVKSLHIYEPVESKSLCGLDKGNDFQIYESGDTINFGIIDCEHCKKLYTKAINKMNGL